MTQIIISGRAIALRASDIDTDQICPARFLHTPRAQGYGGFAFHDLKAKAKSAGALFPTEGSPPPTILVAGTNFGCGSSREQAVWALHDLGVRAVLAPSFGDIFQNNCANNGIAPIRLAEDIVSELSGLIEGYPRSLRLYLDRGKIELPNRSIPFELSELAKRRIVEGQDAFADTMTASGAIAAFRGRHRSAQPWLFYKIDEGGESR